MNILILYNEYRSTFAGESVVIRDNIRLLEKFGHSVEVVTKNSNTIDTFPQKARAFMSGIYSCRARSEIRCILKNQKKDLSLKMMISFKMTFMRMTWGQRRRVLRWRHSRALPVQVQQSLILRPKL